MEHYHLNLSDFLVSFQMPTLSLIRADKSLSLNSTVCEKGKTPLSNAMKHK